MFVFPSLDKCTWPFVERVTEPSERPLARRYAVIDHNQRKKKNGKEKEKIKRKRESKVGWRTQ